MNRSSRPQVLDLRQPPATSSSSVTQPSSRNSFSVDNPLPSNSSTESTASTSPLVNVTPEPAYIASFAATSLVTNDHEDFFRSLRDDGVVGPSTSTMFVTSNSLALVNQFLDFLLHSFLANAKSTSISALRPAIVEVLRARLAKEAVAGADQELQSYLGGEDEDIGALDDGPFGPNNDEWNLERTWRKCRVQCMIYSSLGDLEEDDEVFFSENGLEGAVGLEQYARQSSNPGLVSPAVAIWLTSILEFIGEQTLLIAGHATIARYSAQRIVTASSPSYDVNVAMTFPNKPMVEELDTEKVALNPSLGRMWRQWRKKTRGGRGSISIPARDGILQRLKCQTSLEQGPINDEGCAGDTTTIRAEDFDSPNRDELLDTPTQPDNFRLTSLPGNALAPIVETATPRMLDTSKRLGPRDWDDATRVVLRRPQSLIVLPWTSSPPFVLSTATIRRLSLPDLKRGDFADPNTEGEDVEEYLYMNIPLPQPGPNEEEELADSALNEKQVPRVATKLPLDIAEDPIGLDVVKAPETAVLTSSHLQPPARTGTWPIEREDTVMPQAEPQENDITTTPRLSPNRPLRRPSVDEYDPYTIKSSLPKTPTRPDTCFSDNDLSQSRSESVSPAHLKHVSSSSSGHSLSDRKIGQLHLVPSPSSSHSERGANVRVWTPPGTPDKSRRSSSFSKAQRPTHTSGSTSSQTSILKTFIPWPHDGGKHTRVQESDVESRTSHHSDHLATLDDKERSFEELISSGGTIHCTITPDPIRNMEKLRQGKTPTTDLADFIRSTGSDGRPMTSRSTTGSPRVTAHRNSPTVLDPRTKDNATSSLAGFLGSTAGPGSYSCLASNHAPGSKFQKMTVVGPTSTARNHGLPAVIRQTRSDPPIASTATRNRLLARDASGSTGSDTTSALADFFRNTTPPTKGEQPIHRIPRNVAPFRNTMDSAQFDSQADVDIIEESGPEPSIESRGAFSAPHESYSSSFTSSTALLRSSSRRTVDYGSAASPITSSAPEIKRKQVRAKDPYAIAIDGLDDDDMDDMEGLNLVLPKKREEESLVDFLRNSPPPPQSAPQPLFINANDKTIQKKPSAVSLMSRFGRSGRKNSISSNADRASLLSQGGSSAKHIPLQVSTATSGSDQYSRLYPQARADFDRQYDVDSGIMTARSPMRSNAAARGARAARNDTDSLVDFLKHTGPPPEARTAHPQKEEGRSLLQKMSFSRNKKVGVV